MRRTEARIEADFDYGGRGDRLPIDERRLVNPLFYGFHGGIPQKHRAAEHTGIVQAAILSDHSLQTNRSSDALLSGSGWVCWIDATQEDRRLGAGIAGLWRRSPRRRRVGNAGRARWGRFHWRRGQNCRRGRRDQRHRAIGRRRAESNRRRKLQIVH